MINYEHSASNAEKLGLFMQFYTPFNRFLGSMHILIRHKNNKFDNILIIYKINSEKLGKTQLF